MRGRMRTLTSSSCSRPKPNTPGCHEPRPKLLGCDESNLEVGDFAVHLAIHVRRAGGDDDDVTLRYLVSLAAPHRGAGRGRSSLAEDLASGDDCARAFDDVVQLGEAGMGDRTIRF